MFKQFYLPGILCLFMSLCNAQEATWTIFNYIEADNNVYKYGARNIEAMQRVGSTDKLNILVQLDEPHHQVTWRYKVTKNGFTDDVSLSQAMGINPEQELFQGTLWARTTYPSKYFMLLLWNHGNGILDEPHEAKDYRRRRRSRARKKEASTRGILYDFTNNTFLTNQGLDRALNNFVQSNGGKKINIIGMDACLMDMLEVAYQIKDYGKIFVASQNLEYAPGWFYESFLKKLKKKPYLKPKFLAKKIIKSFARLNQRHSTYTLSAVRLKRTEKVKDDVNAIIAKIEACKKFKPLVIKQAVLFARALSPDFYSGNYIDLHAFYKNLLRGLTEKSPLHSLQERISDYGKARQQLRDALRDAMKRLKKAVLFYQNGSHYADAAGLSIYYPRMPIHKSYALTKFAQDTKWLQFIQEYSAPRMRARKRKKFFAHNYLD